MYRSHYLHNWDRIHSPALLAPFVKCVPYPTFMQSLATYSWRHMSQVSSLGGDMPALVKDLNKMTRFSYFDTNNSSSRTDGRHARGSSVNQTYVYHRLRYIAIRVRNHPSHPVQVASITRFHKAVVASQQRESDRLITKQGTRHVSLLERRDH